MSPVLAITRSVDSLADVGFVPPSWAELAREAVQDGEPNQPRVGWQAVAGRAVESSFLASLRPTLSNADGSDPKVDHWLLLQASADESCVAFGTANPEGLVPPSRSPSQPVPADVAITGRHVLSWGR